MKYRLLTVLAASLAIPAAANAATYELIATDATFETKLCINSAMGPVARLNTKLRKERVPRHKLDRVLKCNNMEVSRFVAAYGTDRMKGFFGVLDTNVQIEDIAKNDDRVIQLYVTSTLSK